VISVVGIAVLADLFSGKVRAMYIGILEISFPIGFIIGPLIGAYLVHLTHRWQSVFILLVILYAICVLMVIILFKETHEKKVKENLKAFFKMYIKVLLDPKFMQYTTIVSLIVCAYLIFIISSPFIYMEQFHLTEIEYGYFQLIPMIFNMLSILIYKYCIMTCNINKIIRFGLKALFLLVPLYFIIAFDIVKVNQYLVLAAVCLQCIILPFFIPGLNSMALDLYPHRKGIAASVMASMKSLISGIGTACAVYVFGSNFNDIFMVKMIIMAIILLLSINLIRSTT
jgi:DHA1 family bicyclomycin/chloramphenicol resistance-like MFS transporter